LDFIIEHYVPKIKDLAKDARIDRRQRDNYVPLAAPFCLRASILMKRDKPGDRENASKDWNECRSAADPSKADDEMWLSTALKGLQELEP
jgi:hypothetical protein